MILPSHSDGIWWRQDVAQAKIDRFGLVGRLSVRWSGWMADSLLVPFGEEYLSLRPPFDRTSMACVRSMTIIQINLCAMETVRTSHFAHIRIWPVSSPLSTSIHRFVLLKFL